MRVIEQKANNAFINKKSIKLGNTEVISHDSNGSCITTLWLYGHKIARSCEDGVEVNFQGYLTSTTQSRLNSLCEALNGTRPFSRKQGKLYMTLRQSERTTNNPVAVKNYSKNEYKYNEWIKVK